MKVAQKISRNTFVSNLLKLDWGGGGSIALLINCSSGQTLGSIQNFVGVNE